jgi:intracellular sulfur oxidation DsrE/DsrF family protein
MTLSRNEDTPQVKDARVIWDCTLGEPDKFVVRLEDIRATMDAFEARGLKTRFAMVVRGPASKLVTQSPPAQPTPTLQNAAGRIAPLLKELAARGMSIEQCGIALGRQGVRQDDLLPLVKVIQNSFVSIVDYELQGYAYVPVDR